ncbi:MAG: hypothetical protein KBS35_02710, partial [Mycoplasma sp.]|nr:hypothetical protein [Candidatus Hennigella equi]
ISPQYVYNNVQTTSWMSGGASGSMMLTQDCEICGIYWGGSSDENNNFTPFFSLFKTADYDFTQTWLNEE